MADQEHGRRNHHGLSGRPSDARSRLRRRGHIAPRPSSPLVAPCRPLSPIVGMRAARGTLPPPQAFFAMASTQHSFKTMMYSPHAVIGFLILALSAVQTALGSLASFGLLCTVRWPPAVVGALVQAGGRQGAG